MTVKRNPVRVAVRDGEVVRLKVCSKCGLEKVASDVSAQSEFSPNTRFADGRISSWRPQCKPCEAVRDRERRARMTAEERRARARRSYEARMADPERRAHRRKGDRERARRRRADPEKAERVLAAVRKYHARKRAEDRDAVNESQRLRYRLLRERQGKPLRVISNPSWVDDPQPRVPAAPFAAWLDAYAEMFQLSTEQIAADLGLCETRLRKVRNGQPTVALDTVDAALIAARTHMEVDGVTVFTLDDLFPMESAAAA